MKNKKTKQKNPGGEQKTKQNKQKQKNGGGATHKKNIYTKQH